MANKKVSYLTFLQNNIECTSFHAMLKCRSWFQQFMVWSI